MLTKLKNEVRHVTDELVSGDHRAAWWSVLAVELVLALLIAGAL